MSAPYTCPVCQQIIQGYDNFMTHLMGTDSGCHNFGDVLANKSVAAQSIVCPICSIRPGGNANY